MMLPFRVLSPDVDESPLPGEAPRALALRLARAKALAVRVRVGAAVIIGSDQVATLDGIEPVGKPGTVARAREQLRRASGRTMRFHTAFAVLAPGRPDVVDCVDVSVGFRVLTAAEIDRYIEREPALDCAGAARCESLGIRLLTRIDTEDPTALIGLPLIRVGDALAAAGFDPLAPAS